MERGSISFGVAAAAAGEPTTDAPYFAAAVDVAPVTLSRMRHDAKDDAGGGGGSTSGRRQRPRNNELQSDTTTSYRCSV